MKIWKLLFWCGIAYAIILVLVRGTLPVESSPTLFLVGLPLIVIAVIIARDLARRSTIPSLPPKVSLSVRLKEDPVRFLGSQIQVAATASDSYFDDVIRSRLKELLITKISLELGVERDLARRTLSDPKRGMMMLRNRKLYGILYGPVPQTGTERIVMIDAAIDEIRDWQV